MTSPELYRTLPTLVVALPSILAFNPDDERAASILRALAEPGGSLDAVAKAHGISLADLALWLTTPRARGLMLTIEQGASAHVRMTASLNLSASVHALVQILDDFSAARGTGRLSASASGSSPPLPIAHSPLPSSPRSSDSSSDSAFSSLAIRRAENARRAAYHLYRLSRIVPLDDAALARARSTISATISTTGRANNRVADTAPTSPSSPLPIAHSPLPTPSSPLPSPSSPLPIAHSPLPSSSPLPSPPLTCGDVLQALETYAASVGLNLADLDGLSLDGIPEDVPIPPEALALFPPEIAAYLLASPPSEPDPHPPPAFSAPTALLAAC